MNLGVTLGLLRGDGGGQVEVYNMNIGGYTST